MILSTKQSLEVYKLVILCNILIFLFIYIKCFAKNNGYSLEYPCSNVGPPLRPSQLAIILLPIESRPYVHY